jgi:hypothetical protein
MSKRKWLKFGALGILLAGAVVIYQGAQAQQKQARSALQSDTRAQEARAQEARAQKVEIPSHPPAPGNGKEMVVQLCDGETNLTVKGVGPEERLTPKQAQAVSNQLMAMWYAKADPATVKGWRQEAATAGKQRATGQSPKKTAPGSSATARQEQPNDFTARDYAVWKKEVDREVKYGDQIFHDDKLVGSTNGVSCAMCHPHGSNTHPETYPKFQIQLKRVALLRDMINWCIENPSRGKKLDADDPKMRALEAYIMAQRKGVAMEYGKH